MAVRLETTIKRYIGHSGDLKPRPGVVLDDGSTISDLPAGSSFLEEDTGRVYRWTGAIWSAAEGSDEQTLLLAEILAEVRALREEASSGLPVVTPSLR